MLFSSYSCFFLGDSSNLGDSQNSAGIPLNVWVSALPGKGGVCRKSYPP